MKKLLLAAATLLTAITTSYGWSRQGHATIAQVAENHLTETTKAKLAEYLHGESIITFASYADEYKDYKLVDLGFDPENWERVTTYPHTYEVDASGNPFHGINDNGRYVKNCVHFLDEFSKDLKASAETMQDSVRFFEIVMCVHWVGDIHCPTHTRIYPTDMTIGKFPITALGKPDNYHRVWDDVMVSKPYPWSFSDLAKLVDICSEEEIREISAGGPYDWAKASAVDAMYVHDEIHEGDTIDSHFVYEHAALTRQQLRNAGYRLAKLLNSIFDPQYGM